MSPSASRRVLAFLVALFAVDFIAVGAPTRQEQGKQDGTAEEQVYEAGGDVKPPKLVHYVEPAFSPKSKEAYVEGTVKISTVVTTAGATTKLQVLRGLNAEEDRTAVEAVKQWKFEPGTLKGQPVNVRVTVEISFHLL